MVEVGQDGGGGRKQGWGERESPAWDSWDSLPLNLLLKPSEPGRSSCLLGLPTEKRQGLPSPLEGALGALVGTLHVHVSLGGLLALQSSLPESTLFTTHSECRRGGLPTKVTIVYAGKEMSQEPNRPFSPRFLPSRSPE